MIPKEPALGLDPGVGTGFRKETMLQQRSRADDDSKRGRPALSVENAMESAS
jgi:hypothetical protein